MKRISLLLILAFVCTMTLAGNVLTASASGPIVGKIKDVDTQEKSLVIGLKDQDQVVYLDQNSQITKEGQSLGLDGLKVGMLVSMATAVRNSSLKQTELFVPA